MAVLLHPSQDAGGPSRRGAAPLQTRTRPALTGASRGPTGDSGCSAEGIAILMADGPAATPGFDADLVEGFAADVETLADEAECTANALRSWLRCESRRRRRKRRGRSQNRSGLAQAGQGLKTRGRNGEQSTPSSGA